MLSCTVCSALVNEDAQYYQFGNMGPEIISTIENDLGHEVYENGTMCSNCFAHIMQRISTPAQGGRGKSMPVHKKCQLQQDFKTNVCVWCQCSLHMRRAHVLPEGLERDFISNTISPRSVPDGSLICYGCWVRVKRILQQIKVEVMPEEDSTSTIVTNTCVWCLRSLNQRRRHPIPEGPERNEIIERIHPREIPSGGLVCYACWVAARRNVQRAAKNIDRSLDQAHHNRNVVCALCGMSLFRRQTHSLPSGPERNEVAARIQPCQLSEHALLCTTCWRQTVEHVQVKQENVQQEVQQQLNTSIELDQFTHTTSCSSRCFVPQCTNPERLRVPGYLRKQLLTLKKVFVTENARVCKEHKTLYDWEFLNQNEFSNTFTKNEMESMLSFSIN